MLSQVFVYISRQNQLNIVQWCVVDQVVQLGKFVHVAGDYVLESDAVDRDHDTVIVSDFDIVGVGVVLKLILFIEFSFIE